MASLEGIKVGDHIVPTNGGRLRQVIRLTRTRAFFDDDPTDWVRLTNGRHPYTRSTYRLATADEVAEAERQAKRDAERAAERIERESREAWLLASRLSGWFGSRSSIDIEKALTIDQLRRIAAIIGD